MEKKNVLALSELVYTLFYTQKFVASFTKIENLDASYLFCNLKLQTVAINFMRNMLELNFLVIF